MRTAAKSVGTLTLLAALLPFNLALTVIALLRARLAGTRARHPRPTAGQRRTVLVSGGKMTKALALARAFHRAGHRVILVESGRYRLSGHRFSEAVDRFAIVPDARSPEYAQALLDLVLSEGVDAYVPVCSPVSSLHDSDAKALLAPHCDVIHLDPDDVRTVDDKHAFAKAAEALGLAVPDAHRITDPQQVLDFDFAAHGGGPYVLKSIAYDPIRRLDLTPLPRPSRAETEAFLATLPISEENPWVMQAFVEGREFCTHSTVRDGQVQLHCCCESSAFQLNYGMVDRPDIEEWVRTFAGALGLTGQVSFDFIEAADGQVYAIECNPRTHSAITMFYDHPGVSEAYLEHGVQERTPTPASKPTFWLYHELWRLISRPQAARRTLGRIARGKDAIFDWNDPLPFLMVHHAQIPSLLLGNLRRGREWRRIDFNIGKLVEPAGD